MENRGVWRTVLIRTYFLSLGIGIAILLIGAGMFFIYAQLEVAAEKRYLACYTAKCGQLDSLKAAAAISRGGITSWSMPVEISGLAAAVTSLVNLLALAITARSIKQ